MEKVTLENFVSQAIITESNDFESIGKRLAKVENMRLLHSVVGISTELTELIEAIMKPQLDLVNIKEELSDAIWYCAIACDVLKIEFKDLISDSYELAYEQNRNSYLKQLKKISFLKKIVVRYQLQFFINQANKGAGNCLDVMKKTIYYQNREFNEVKFKENLTLTMASFLLILSEIVEASLEDTLQMLIDKLQKVRYKQGKFTAEEASNRDLETERKILEQK